MGQGLKFETNDNTPHHKSTRVSDWPWSKKMVWLFFGHRAESHSIWRNKITQRTTCQSHFPDANKCDHLMFDASTKTLRLFDWFSVAFVSSAFIDQNSQWKCSTIQIDVYTICMHGYFWQTHELVITVWGSFKAIFNRARARTMKTAKVQYQRRGNNNKNKWQTKRTRHTNQGKP